MDSNGRGDIGPLAMAVRMTRAEKIEIMAAELAKCEQMTLAACRRWIERCVVAVDRVAHERYLADYAEREAA